MPLDELLMDPQYHDLLAILKGTKNGIVYGTKLRFSHALVMSFLFRSGSIKSRWRGILRATQQHARALGSFVFFYKTTLYILRRIRFLLAKRSIQLPRGFKGASPSSSTILDEIHNHENGLDAFIGGIVGGYLVFGRNSNSAGANSINQQMVLYVFSRVVIGLSKMIITRGIVPTLAKIQDDHVAQAHVFNVAWTILATVSWGSVMYLFRTDSALLQHSMLHSMKYLYVESESWSSIWDFI